MQLSHKKEVKQKVTQQHTLEFDMVNNARGVIPEAFKGIQLTINK